MLALATAIDVLFLGLDNAPTEITTTEPLAPVDSAQFAIRVGRSAFC